MALQHVSRRINVQIQLNQFTAQLHTIIMAPVRMRIICEMHSNIPQLYSTGKLPSNLHAPTYSRSSRWKWIINIGR